MEIFLTGSTGMVGSSLLPRLAEKYRVICLVRKKRGESAVERIRRISTHKNIEVLEGDVTFPDCGIPPAVVSQMKGGVAKVVHCAASVRFDESAKDEIWSVNENGVRNVLKLATDLGVTEFYHTSTAYIAGNTQGIFTEEQCSIGQIPRNPYEASKLMAEQHVRSWATANMGRNITILRPSILVGDWETGETFSFDGYYGFFRPLWGFKKMLQEKRLLPDDIQFDGEILHVPLCIPCSSLSTINLVPRDWIVDAMARLIDMPATGQTYHLVHPSPPRVRWVIEKTLSFMGISGIQCGGEKSVTTTTSGLLKRVQRRIDAELKRYAPYVHTEAIFEQAATIKALGNRGLPRPISEEYLGRLISYAENQWETERQEKDTSS